MAGGGGSVAKASSAGVRIVVAGDRGTGKTGLIVTAATDNFPINPAPVLPPMRLPDDLYPDRVPVTIIDTSSRLIHLCSSLSLYIYIYLYYLILYI